MGCWAAGTVREYVHSVEFSGHCTEQKQSGDCCGQGARIPSEPNGRKGRHVLCSGLQVAASGGH